MTQSFEAQPGADRLPASDRDGHAVSLEFRRVSKRYPGQSDPAVRELSLEVPAGVVELLRLDVDSRQADAGELLSQYRQHCAHAAPDLEQARSGLELRAVADQPVAARTWFLIRVSIAEIPRSRSGLTASPSPRSV